MLNNREITHVIAKCGCNKETFLRRLDTEFLSRTVQETYNAAIISGIIREEKRKYPSGKSVTMVFKNGN